MGRHLVDELILGGVDVTVLVRSDSGADALRAAGATVIRGDLGRPSGWERAARDADVVFHAALPRITPPLRHRQLRTLAKKAEAGAATLRDVVGGDTNVVVLSCAIGDSRGPLSIAEPGLAAERGLRGTGTRVVRLPWAYGRTGFLADMQRGLVMRRFRIVGSGTNTIALISARDGARAAMAAADAPPGTYSAAEDSLPTQQELVHHICVTRGVPRPDHLPPRIASVSLGGVVVEALVADQVVTALPLPGFRPRHAWREALVRSTAPRDTDSGWGRALASHHHRIGVVRRGRQAGYWDLRAPGG